jgi:S-adenosylmethionine decarboxylase
MSPIGRHVTLDAELVSMPDRQSMLEACEAAIRASGMNVECVVRKDFQPQGMTAVWVLSESHFTLHTYPEIGYVSVDCYTCGNEGNPEAAIDHLLGLLSVRRSSRRSLSRGQLA